MNSASINITDMYMGVLSSLSTDEKLDLIGKLLESIRKKKHATSLKSEADVFACFSGDWSEFNPERNFDRNVEIW